MAAEPDAAKLVCIAGPAAGVEFPLFDGEVVVGRANDNPISIPDTSVSRKHARLTRRGADWHCGDLGSGNGTLVNGESIEEEVLLQNGDVITLGDTELSFVRGGGEAGLSSRPSGARVGRASGSGAAVESSYRRGVPSRPDVRARLGRTGAPTASPDAQKRKKKILLGVLAGATLVVASLVGAKLYLKHQEEQALVQAQRAEATRQKLGAIFQAGKNLVRDGKWQEAKQKFLEVKGLAPEYPTIDQFLEKAEAEIPNELALEEARVALEKNAVGEAAAALARVSPTTQLFEPLRELHRLLEDKIASQLRDGQIKLQAAPSGGAGREALTQVVAIMEDLLLARPEHRDAKVLRDEAQDRLTRLDRPNAPRPASTVKPWDEAVIAFREGELKDAQELANECAGKVPKCRELLADMKAFAELHKKLEDLDAKGLARLLQLDREITGGTRSKLARNAETRAGNIYYKSAASAKASGQWARAMEHATKTLDADPTHQGAKALVDEIRAKAKDVFLLGYSLKDQQPEEALQKFREVLQMTPKSDEYHAKATHWIQQLDR